MKKRPINKRTMRNFARHLYESRGDHVSYVPLGCHELVEETPSGRVCCVLGEMYEYFLGRPVDREDTSSAVRKLVAATPKKVLRAREPDPTWALALENHRVDDPVYLQFEYDLHDLIDFNDLDAREWARSEDERTRLVAAEVRKLANRVFR